MSSLKRRRHLDISFFCSPPSRRILTSRATDHPRVLCYFIPMSIFLPLHLFLGPSPVYPSIDNFGRCPDFVARRQNFSATPFQSRTRRRTSTNTLVLEQMFSSLSVSVRFSSHTLVSSSRTRIPPVTGMESLPHCPSPMHHLETCREVDIPRSGLFVLTNINLP